jgi:hypothetical protein
MIEEWAPGLALGVRYRQLETQRGIPNWRFFSGSVQVNMGVNLE